ncbi:MAG: hypothetical protein KC457_23790, partial [Myxococcales bacterium]|nr:hypothetical protein [Myxococcales bacterium]
MELEALIRGLRETLREQAGEAGEVEVIQTHISVVFLVGREVFKVHKPVDFGFLNFTTLEARRRDCEAEVAVNQDLAPEIYRGVVAIVLDDQGRPRVDREPRQDEENAAV